MSCAGALLLAGAVLLSAQTPPQAPEPKWHYGAWFDLGYLLDFNHPENGAFRSRGTTWHVDEVDLNMAAAYLRKTATEQSRWGTELTVQGGKDSELFALSPTAPNLAGYRGLRHLGPTNVSYLAPVGKGLTVQGGIFGSLIGYDSLYSKDNLNYTRPWGADFTPYFMMGVNASYPLTAKLTGALFAINGYWHLADANSVPSSGGQLTYKPTSEITVKETFLAGSHQPQTALNYWRVLTDTILERKKERSTIAVEYIYSSERVAGALYGRALMMSGQLPMRLALTKRWSAIVRPEFFWDRNGRWTTYQQTVKAITSSLEYRLPYRRSTTILRFEHRYDDSRGPQGGFFRGALPALTPGQHLLIAGVIFALDSQ